MTNNPIVFTFQKDGLYFEKYDISFSTIKKNKILKKNEILLVDLNTIPPTIITKQYEVIFLTHDSKNDLELFAKTYNLKTNDKIDIWEIICRFFLDSEWPVSHDEFTKAKELGFDQGEIDIIRTKVENTFFMNSEWSHLSQLDLLLRKQTSILYKLTGRKFYWWTMEIATRGLRTTTGNSKQAQAG